MTDHYAQRHLEQRIINDADQIEQAAIQYGSTTSDAGIRDEQIAGALDDHTVEESVVVQNAWHATDLEIDNASGSSLEEIQRRARLLNKNYPFKIEDNKISYTGSKTGVYEFCLAASINKDYSGEYAKIPRIFEKISAVAVKKYLGQDSFAIHCGSPRGRYLGSLFRDAMSKVHKITGEWFWGPTTPLPADPTTTGDEGLDFIVWKRNLDGRLGQLFLIGQCACGDDWNQKFGDLTLDHLEKWFNKISYIAPVRVFAVPHHLSDNNIIFTSIDAGLVFDRARITLLAENLTSEREIKHWTPRILKSASLVLDLPSRNCSDADIVEDNQASDPARQN